MEAAANDDLEGSSGSGLEPQREATGLLLSPSLEHDEWSCLRLVYQIAESGRLEVLRRAEGRSFDEPLWSSEAPSDSWVIASVDLQNNTEPFRVNRPLTVTPSWALRGPVSLVSHLGDQVKHEERSTVKMEPVGAAERELGVF